MRKNTSQVSERIGVHLHAIWCRQKPRWPLWVLCSHTSSNYFIKSWVPVCVCAGACVFTQPPGCNDGSRRLLFHSRQVWTYSSQRPAKPGDTLTVIANLHHGCSVSRVCSICSVQTREDTASADGELIVTALIFLNKKNNIDMVINKRHSVCVCTNGERLCNVGSGPNFNKRCSLSLVTIMPTPLGLHYSMRSVLSPMSRVGAGYSG